MQEYFLVACSLADAIRRFRESNSDWRLLPEKAAIQLNDTHPTLAVPELMRILLDEAHLGWDEAWDITRATLAYTNHTLASRGARALAGRLDATLDSAPARDHLRDQPAAARRHSRALSRRPRRVARTSLVEEGQTKHIRMANLAIVGSHSTNGVAAIHSELLRKTTVKDLAEAFPGALQQQDQRSHAETLAQACQSLALDDDFGARSATAGSRISPELAEASAVDEGRARSAPSVQKAKRAAKARFADWVKRHTDVTVDPDTIFDCQIKRIHEYKRQLLNALRIVVHLSASAREPGSRHPAAHVLLRGQGGAGLLSRESHHQVHQQPGADDRRRSCDARQAQGRVPAGIQCHAG